MVKEKWFGFQLSGSGDRVSEYRLMVVSCVVVQMNAVPSDREDNAI